MSGVNLPSPATGPIWPLVSTSALPPGPPKNSGCRGAGSKVLWPRPLGTSLAVEVFPTSRLPHVAATHGYRPGSLHLQRNMII